MADEQTLRRLKRIQELKAADTTLTSQKALEMIRREEEHAEESGKREEKLEEEQEEGEEKRAKESAARRKKFLGAQKVLGKTLRAGGTFAGGAAVGGAAVGAKAAGTFADYGIVIAIVGLFTFFADLTGSPVLFVILETVLLFISAWFIFEKRGIVLVSFFWWWYFFKGGAVTTDPQGILSFLLVFFLISAVVRAFISKFWEKEGFFQGGGMEIVGLIPIVTLLLDMGAAEYLIRATNSIFSLNITISGTLLEDVLIFTPWWTILGIMTIKKENIVVTFLKVLCVVYFFSIVFGAIGHEGYIDYQSHLPGPTEFLEAKKEFREQAAPRIHPLKKLWNQLGCNVGDPLNAAECIQKKEEEEAIEKVCKDERGLIPGSVLYKECKQQELLKKKNPSFQVFGAVDPSIKEPTTAKVLLDTKSFPGYGQNLPFPAEVEIKNPRRQHITVEATCSFDGKDGAEDVQGRVPQNLENQPFIISDTVFKETFLCYPEEGAQLEGKYFLQFNVTLRELNTTSRLQRAFIGDKTQREKDRLYAEEISRVIKQKSSLAPADFAWLTFDVGHALEEVMIENKPYRKIFVRSKIENKGRGELVKVHKYSIDLPEFGFVTDDTATGEAAFGCTSYDRAFVPRASDQREKSIALTICEIKDFPEEFKNPEDWIPMQFLGTLHYDYRVTAKAEVKIEKPPEVGRETIETEAVSLE